MNTTTRSLISYPLFFLLFNCCSSSAPQAIENEAILAENATEKPSIEQIGEYVINVFEDKHGNLWIGTLNKGLARYNGKKLEYFTMADGLPSNGVGSIVEDHDGNLWLGTHSGISKVESATDTSAIRFTNYSMLDGLVHERISSMYVDTDGIIWIGTWGGVCTMNPALFPDSINFTHFPLPKTDVDLPAYVETGEWVTTITGDDDRNIWIARSGYGALKYNPKAGSGVNPFTEFTTKNGLPSNGVHAVLVDGASIWFGTRMLERDAPNPSEHEGKAGLVRLLNGEVVLFSEYSGLSESDVYSVEQDDSGSIWVSSIANGLYKIDGDVVRNFNTKSGIAGIVSILEDRSGRIWIGSVSGLFRLEGDDLINVSQNGPWPLD